MPPRGRFSLAGVEDDIIDGDPAATMAIGQFEGFFVVGAEIVESEGIGKLIEFGVELIGVAPCQNGKDGAEDFLTKESEIWFRVKDELGGHEIGGSGWRGLLSGCCGERFNSCAGALGFVEQRA